MKPSRLSLVLVQVAARMVPARYRSDWRAEWRAELWAVSAARGADVFQFVLGSFSDAWFVRCHSAPACLSPVQSPEACLALLASGAILTAIVFPRLVHGASQVTYFNPNLVFAVTVAVSVGLLNSIWSWEIAIPVGTLSVQGLGVRWYLFLVAKFGAVLTVAHQATVHLVAHGLPPQAVLVGCIAGFLWVQREQRQRCPVCLHRLARPVRVGTYSQTFLGWNGIESICLKGHGALYTGNETIGRESHTEWTGMDSTWSDLFPARH